MNVLSRITSPVALLVLALVALTLPFCELLFDPELILTYRDLFSAVVPSKKIWLESVQTELALPVWNPYVLSGVPYFADLKHAVLDPFNVILLFFSPERIFYAMSWFIYLHHPVLFAGMLLLLRRLQCQRGIAVVFALIYSLSGMVISSHSMPNLLGAQVALPWFAFFWLRLKSRGFPFFSRDCLALLFFFLLPLLCASPMTAYFLALALLGSLAARFSRINLIKLAGFFVCAGLLSAVITLPAVDLILAADRVRDAGAMGSATDYSVPWPRFLDLFLIAPFGNYSVDGAYWIRSLDAVSRRDPLFFSLYLGSPVLFAVVFAATYANRRVWLFFAALIVLFALAMGHFAPINFYSGLVHILPLFGLVRYPEKILILFGFALTVFSAMQWNKIIGSLHMVFCRRFLLVLGAVLALIAVAFYLVVWLYQGNPSPGPVFGFLVGQLALLFFVYFIFYQKRFFAGRWLLLLLLVSTDMVVSARGGLWSQPAILLDNALARSIQASLEKRSDAIKGGAAHRMSSYYAYPLQKIVPAQIADRFDGIFLSNLSIASRLLQNTSGLYGISNISGSAHLFDSDRKIFHVHLNEKRRDRLPDIYSAYYFVRLPDATRREMHFDGNPDAFSYIYLAESVRFVADRERLLDAVASDSLQRNQLVLVADQRNGRFTGVSGKVRVLARKMATHKIAVHPDQYKSTEQSGWLVLNESFSRHWRATIDGKSVPVKRANGWSMAVDLSGHCLEECVVEWRHENAYIRWGAIISLLTLLCFLTAIWRKTAYRRAVTRNAQ